MRSIVMRKQCDEMIKTLCLKIIPIRYLFTISGVAIEFYRILFKHFIYNAIINKSQILWNYFHRH